MGLLPNGVPWYTLIGIAIILTIHDIYQWLHLKTSQLCQQVYDIIDDRLLSLTHSIVSTSDAVLYKLHLSPSSRPPKSFPRFSELPAEIRSQIWQEAMPGPRTLEIRHPVDPSSRLVRGDIESARSISRVPNLLHTCREARGEALRIYELWFGVGAGGGMVYVDFERDTVHFGVRSDFYGVQSVRARDQNGMLRFGGGRLSHVRDLEKIKSLALRSESFEDVNKLGFGVFKELREIVLVGQSQRRRFDLGRQPTLVKVREKGTRSFAVPEVWRHFFELRSVIEIRRKQCEK